MDVWVGVDGWVWVGGWVWVWVWLWLCVIVQDAVLGVIVNHRAGEVQISSDESFFEELKVST